MNNEIITGKPIKILYLDIRSLAKSNLIKIILCSDHIIDHNN